MGRALLYYEWHSRWNRLCARLRRLRQPKYLFGAVVGGLYFYWYVFGAWFRRGAPGATPRLLAPEHRALLASVAALVLCVVLLLMWIIPHERAALVFSEAEVAFLFPAPVARRTLIHFKLLKSQGAILFSALFLLLFGRWSGGSYLFHFIAWWALLSIINLHLLGSSFARTMLLERGISNWRRRLLVLGAVALAVSGVILWARQALPAPPDVSGNLDLSALAGYAGQILQSGPLPWLLAPFRWAVAPLFARDAGEFCLALGPVLGIIALHYWWVIRANVAFEEASVELSRKFADRVAAMRSGNWQAMSKPKRAKRPPFALPPQGWPAVAIFWKNLISAGQFFTGRAWFFLIWITVIAGLILRSGEHHPGGGVALSILAFSLAVMSLLYGPQILRHDLRAADMLKLYPMSGWQMVLGEILAPAAILAGVQWLLVLFAFLFCPASLGGAPAPAALRVTAALAAALVLPCVDFIALLLPNAAALIFPAWVQLGKDTPRGFETMGQQLILMFGQIIVLTLTMLPAAVAGAVAWLLAGWLFGKVMAVALASAALAVAAVLAAEAAVGVHLLGKAFDRFDWSEGSVE
jgi:ABC-2 type transport system permease protein